MTTQHNGSGDFIPGFLIGMVAGALLTAMVIFLIANHQSAPHLEQHETIRELGPEIIEPKDHHDNRQ